MIGRIITERRIELGLKQSDVAKGAGISIATLQSIEIGRRNPSWEVIQKICTFLQLKIDISKEL